jgi:hypothetical protein
MLLASALAVACVVPPAADTDTATGPSCAKSVRFGRLGLPAPLRITTSCAVYTVSPDGRVVVSRKPPSPRGVTWMSIAGAGAPVLQRGDRIVVLRNGREIWRSVGRFRATGVFAIVGGRAVAFSFERYEGQRSRESLYIARFGGSEREVAPEERPLGWTRAGDLLTWRFSHGSFDVFVRDRDGILIGRVGAQLREVRFDSTSETMLALTRSGILRRFDGHHWSHLANLRTHGFRRAVLFEPLAGGLIGLLEGARIGVLRADGSLFATAAFPARLKQSSVAGHSGMVANANGSAVAFAVTRGNDGYGNAGMESLYEVRPGDSRARMLYRGRLRFAICERWVSLSWHGNWLLYATTEGQTIALDSNSPGRRADLSGLVRRLGSLDAEPKVDAQVEWAP